MEVEKVITDGVGLRMPRVRVAKNTLESQSTHLHVRHTESPEMSMLLELGRTITELKLIETNWKPSSGKGLQS